ncbi:MAG: hypothetical protein HDR92_05200 [Bacteroides sp.]|nr:hypothetical protein [Bacteroides sp.]
MSLEGYLLSESKSAQEIRWDFHPGEVSQLYNLLQESGYEKYLAFVRHNLKDILRYIALSPSQRTQKKWINHPDGLLLRFAALQIAELTERFLKDSVGASRIVDRDSYRKFHAVFANSLAPLLLDPDVLRNFPFDGFDLPF